MNNVEFASEKSLTCFLAIKMAFKRNWSHCNLSNETYQKNVSQFKKNRRCPSSVESCSNEPVLKDESSTPIFLSKLWWGRQLERGEDRNWLSALSDHHYHARNHSNRKIRALRLGIIEEYFCFPLPVFCLALTHRSGSSLVPDAYLANIKWEIFIDVHRLQAAQRRAH